MNGAEGLRRTSKRTAVSVAVFTLLVLVTVVLVQRQSCVTTYGTRLVLADTLTIIASDLTDTAEDDARQRLVADRIEDRLHVMPTGCTLWVDLTDLHIDVDVDR